MSTAPQQAPERPLVTLAVIATAATVILTGAAFWLSYEHLHDVAALHGLGHAASRSWAWPGTVDLFIVIGEVLILRAALARIGVDPWAIALTVVGSGGSIALNVAGVGAHAQPMDYVVAAVPPVAALLAFGALMRQLHGALAARVVAAPVALPPMPIEAPQTAPEDALPDAPKAPRVDLTKRPKPPPESAPEVEVKAPRKALPKRRGGTTRSAAKTALEALYDIHGRRPVESEMVAELQRIKYAHTSRQHANKLRAEIEKSKPKLAELGADNVRALTGS